MAVNDINRYLDHAVLKPELTRSEATEAIKLGVDYNVRTVCVRPCDISLAASICSGTQTDVSCVVAFPHGCTTSGAKAKEAELCVQSGTREIDMVANFGFIRSGMWDEVVADIQAVVEVARPSGILVKVIFETAYLSVAEITRATQAAIDAGADFVKTSTGFAAEGATEEKVAAMIKAAGGRISVKASGGVRDRERAEMFVQMGVSRIGNGYNSTAAICDGTPSDKSGGY